MKRAAIILFAAFAVIIQAHAQEKPEAVAKAQVAEISDELELSDDQQRTLFRVFLRMELDYRKEIQDKGLEGAEKDAKKKEIDTAFDSAMQETLSEDQYKKYCEMLGIEPE